ncbi:MAG: hypothetical protein KDE59_20355 [Anaerolineales bacterium]|nr:hypothetical protein [Anaerolineales bacterium]
MNTNDKNFLKLKVALAASGLMATLVGAGLLGQAAAAVATTTTGSETVVAPASETNVTTLDTTMPEALDLELDAIPTVVAPNTTSSVRVAVGRSSR